MRLCFPVCLLMACAGCLPAAELLRVSVSVLPLESLIKEIGGDLVEVRSLQREGDSCSHFEPRPSSVTWLAGSALFFRVGVGYENGILRKIQQQYPAMRVHDLREAVEIRQLAGHHGHSHHHGACSDLHADPHVWLDPVRLAEMAEWVAGRLGESLPAERERFMEQARGFRERAMALHFRLVKMLGPHRGSAFYVYHPALGYFAERYGLQQVSIAGASGAPTPRQLQQLAERARSQGVRVILVQPQESRRHAEVVAGAIGARLVEIDPMSPDWESNLLQLAAAVQEALPAEPESSRP